jgi:hypothetical protein
MSSFSNLGDILRYINNLIIGADSLGQDDIDHMNGLLEGILDGIKSHMKKDSELHKCIKDILHTHTKNGEGRPTTPQEYINTLAGIRHCVNGELIRSGESSGFVAVSQSPSVAGSTMSAIAEPTRVFNMLNSIEHCRVENAMHKLTSLEVKLYDGRHALIQTFMNLVSPTASSGAKTNPSSIASNPGVSVSRSIDRKDAIQVDEIMQGSYKMKKIEITIDKQRMIDKQRIEDSSRITRAAKTVALKRLSGDKPRVALAVELSSEEIEKLNAAQARQARQAQAGQAQAGQAQAGQARQARQAQAGQAQTVTSKEPSLDMFDDMMSPVNKLKLLEFATYIAAKSEPCQVHDRTECEYADMLRKYREDGDADRVYTEMLSKRFIKDYTQMLRVQKLHNGLKTHFDSVKPAKSSAKNVGQQACRDCAVLMFETYKEHANTTSSSHVPAAEVVLTMPYSVYREIKNDATQQEDNDITTALQGNNGPRGFDATSSWGNNLVNWYWAMGSCDAAVQAFDSKHNIFAFQYTKCVFDDPPPSAVPPRIQSKFTVVDRRKGRSPTQPAKINCIPLQFGHKTVECVFNPNLNSKIQSVMATPISISTLENPPFLCTYMPEVTLNHFSEQDDANGPDGKGKGNVKGKSKTIPHWKDLHDGFISKCEGEFGEIFFRTAADNSADIGDAIPDKITHMGITWVLTAVSQGPVSLDATLDKINLACDTVKPRNLGCTKEARWVVLSDMFLDEFGNTNSECAKYIGFTCGSSAKERGDAGKYWDMFWTQKYLNTPCSFWSGDYLAVAATTAPGLAWGIVVNSKVTVWGAEGQRPTINKHELRKIKKFVEGARSKGEQAYEFFISRIKMLLEYLAFTFIREIISLIRVPSVSADPEQHVALDTILILCAALSSITSSVELITDTAGNFTPAVVINNACYLELPPETFNEFVPASPDDITRKFCSDNGIYDRESYFRKLIPLTGLNNALNKHSGLLWAYDYISTYNPDERLTTTDLFEIFNLHQPPSRKRTNKTDPSGEKIPSKMLEKTFASVDVLCIAKMVRDTTSNRGADDQYNSWLKQLCTGKLDEFLKVNRCRDVFCELVRFNMPHRLGGGANRLHAYLDGQLFPAQTFCQQVGFSDVSDSFDPPISPVRSARGSILLPSSVRKPGKPLVGDDSQEPTLISSSQPRILESVSQTCQLLNDTNPEQFMTDMENAYACTHQPETRSTGRSKKQSLTRSHPPFHAALAGSGASVAQGSFGVGAHAGQPPCINPEQFTRDPENAYACSQERSTIDVGEEMDQSGDDIFYPPASGSGAAAAAAVRSQRKSTRTYRSHPYPNPNPHYEWPTESFSRKAVHKKKGGNTKRTKRYKRNSNRRYKKNTTYSYRKHNRTIKHRNTRRRK